MKVLLGKVLVVVALMLVKATASADESGHWAYQPIRPTSLPHIGEKTRAITPIDRFVLQRLDSAGLALSPEADRQTLIRRVTLDLIGLPPTPEEVESFVLDQQPGAYERLVDRLLCSPHYGERWARPWMDLCHYADSDGYLTDQLRPVAWRYRQWLVEALNANQPFDQFTIEQLAGDLLPGATLEQRLATGFLRQTFSNREGGADPEEFRVKQVVDRTTMVGEIWLGLTVGCAQCHDHKYDAISQKEFFQLYAFLDPADEINVDAPLAGEWQPHAAVFPEYQRQRLALLAPVAEEVERLQRRWEAKLLHARDHPGQDWVWDRQWEVLGLIWGGGLGEGQLEGWQIVLLDPARRSPEQRDRLLDYFLDRGEVIDPTRFRELKLAELHGELRKLQRALPKLTRAPIVRQTLNPRTVHVHEAGDFRNRGEQVSPATPAILPPLRKQPQDRLALAKWLVSPENPLTARVVVNRHWQEFFGRGLVETSADFGVRGTPPTHPELLDWLAGEFRRDGDVKRLQRLIVASATYRQSSHASAELVRADPQNKLLGRQSALRLTAEQIRDAALSVSGLLDPRLGGPSVRPPQPDSVSEQGYGNTWEASSGGDRYRRGLYTFIQRTSPFAMHVTFDAPNPSHICTRRERSNTPLQALTLLNDPVFHEAAAALAARVTREAGSDDTARLVHAFQLCLAREPQPRELAILSETLQRDRESLTAPLAAGSSAGDDPSWVLTCSVLLNLHEFITRN